MEYINNLIIDGNLTKDPEFKEISDGVEVCNFSIACNRRYKVKDEWKEEVSYFEITAWKNGDEDYRKNLQKGRGVRVIGRLKQDRWEDPDGGNRSKVKIIAEHVYIKHIPQKEQAGSGEKSDDILVAV